MEGCPTQALGLASLCWSFQTGTCVTRGVVWGEQGGSILGKEEGRRQVVLYTGRKGAGGGSQDPPLIPNPIPSSRQPWAASICTTSLIKWHGSKCPHCD